MRRATRAACASAKLRVELGLEKERVLKLLCATDLLPKTGAAIERAAQLAEQIDAELSVLHVTQSVEDARRIARGLQRARALSLRFRTTSPLWTRGRAVPEVLVRTGNVSKVLPHMAEQLNAALIVLGPQRKRGMLGTLSATIAQQVLDASGCPVLTVHHRPAGRYRNILLAVDGSKGSMAAIRVAESWLLEADSDSRASIVVSHAPTYEGMLAHANTRTDSSETYSMAWRADTRATLEALLKRVSADSQYDILIEEDQRPAAAILRVAERLRPDLLVMGTRGRRRWRRALFGSVARQVLRTVHCDVLLVPEGPYEPSIDRIARASGVGGNASDRV